MVPDHIWIEVKCQCVNEKREKVLLPGPMHVRTTDLLNLRESKIKLILSENPDHVQHNHLKDPCLENKMLLILP